MSFRERGGGRFGLVVEQGEDDDDDFMNVKRVDHKLADSDSEDDKKYNADEKAAEIARKRALKGKLKIKESGHGANKRVVFDDEGTSMAPLQALGVKRASTASAHPGNRYARLSRRTTPKSPRSVRRRIESTRAARHDCARAACERSKSSETLKAKMAAPKSFSTEALTWRVIWIWSANLNLTSARCHTSATSSIQPSAGMRGDAEEKLESLEERALRLLEG